MAMADDKIRRIQNFLSFLNSCHTLLMWVGGGIFIFGVLLMWLGGHSIYYSLFPGLLLGGLVLLLASYVRKNKVPLLLEEILNDGLINVEEDIRKKIKLFLLAIITGILVCIAAALIPSMRYLITSFIPLIIYVSIEYVVHVTIQFRLQLLRQEIDNKQY